MKKVAFLGAGNMGGAMIRAMLQTGAVLAENMYVYDPDQSRLERFVKELGCKACASNQEAVSKADIIFLAVKPIAVETVLRDIAEPLGEKILVSIAAGVKVEAYANVLGKQRKLVRTIPNLPAMVGEGVTGVFFAPLLAFCEEEKAFVETLLSSFGHNILVSRESLIDEMVAVTSSSPAIFCVLAEAMADGAVRAGFSRAQSYEMVEQAILGTAKYLLETGVHPAVLKDQVCSPAGTTIESVAALERTGFRNSILVAMDACAKKARG